MKKLSTAALLLAAGVSMTAQAGFVSGQHVLSNGNKVDLQGLEWLPLAHTAGLSRNQIAAGFTDTYGNTWGANVWRYATRAEVDKLLRSLWDKQFNGYSNGNAAGAWWFLRHLGGLGFDTGSGANRIDQQRNENGFTQQDYSYFLFGADGDCHPSPDATCYGLVVGFENFNISVNGYSFQSAAKEISYQANSGAAGYFADGLGINMSGYASNVATYKSWAAMHQGSLLVRSAASVSSPAVFGLFSLGFAGLALSRRRTMSK